MAFVLAEEMILLGKRFGVERLGFLTLTFADNVQSIKEAQRRFHSLNTHVLRTRYEKAIGCWERQKSGRIHFHLVVVVGADIRTGANFEEFERKPYGVYKSANPALRSEWAFWRKTAPLYRFGRTELLPVKSTAEGIARYVGKYVSKHIDQRDEKDKGARVVRFLGYRVAKLVDANAQKKDQKWIPGERRISAGFAWNTAKAWLWRQKAKAFFKSRGIDSIEDVVRRVGKNWAWIFKGEIIAQVLPEGIEYPSLEAYEQAKEMETPAWWAYVQAQKILESPEFMKAYLLQPARAFQRKSK